MIPLIEKVCRVCGVSKELSLFHKNKTCKDGHVGTCRDCTNKRVRGWLEDTRQVRRDLINTRNRERKALAVERFGGVCHDCGGTFPQCVYEFHHLDPSKKDWNPSQSLTHSVERMWKELDKCIMLCSNCHKIRHWGGA